MNNGADLQLHLHFKILTGKKEEIESGFPNLSKGRSACIVDPNCQVAIKFYKGKSLFKKEGEKKKKKRHPTTHPEQEMASNKKSFKLS